MNSKAKKITITAMICALAYVMVVFCRIHIVLFLEYEPKDAMITLGGFIGGPITACLVSIIVSFIEMVTISEDGVLGLVMNILSTCAFACTASFIYKRKRKFSGAALGLLSGSILMTAFMLLWNYLITPVYMGIPREAVAELLVPAFLPFNLIKAGANTGLTLLLYRPVIKAYSGYMQEQNMLR
mgnify:FL=1